MITVNKAFFCIMTLCMNISFYSAIQAALQVNYKVINYADLIQKSGFIATLGTRDPQACLEFFMANGSCTADTVTYVIQSVPGRFCKTHIRLVIERGSDFTYSIKAYDAKNMPVFDASIDVDTSTAELCNLRTCSDIIVCTEDSYENRTVCDREISGKTAMSIWDSLCIIFGIRTGIIDDDAMINDYCLREFYPYITGGSWYSYWGYHVQPHERPEWDNRHRYLSCLLIRGFCSKLPQKESDFLLEAARFFDLTTEKPLAQLVSAAWRMSSIAANDFRIKAQEYFKKIYTILTSYNGSDVQFQKAQGFVANRLKTLRKKYTQ